MPELMSLVLLLAALAAFVASTRQVHVLVRLLLLAVGFACLGATGFQIWHTEGGGGYLKLLANLAQNWSQPQNSVLFLAIEHNRGAALQNTVPLLGISLALTALLGLLALAALTPGERIERIVRKSAVFIGGMVAGSALAMSLVAIGLGGEVKQRLYAGVVNDLNDVHDGDTFYFGETSIRIWGLDAPELKQTCLEGMQQRDCGKEARAALFEFIKGKLVVCESGRENSRPPVESFGRPVLHCRFAEPGADPMATEYPPNSLNFNAIAVEMIKRGHAIAYRGDGEDLNEFRRKLTEQPKYCMHDPRVWRRNRLVREDPERWERKEMLGRC